MPIDIGSRREVFWDEFLIDTESTTAQLKLHRPREREVVLVHDRPWEGDGCDFHNILDDGDLHRMYYLGWQMYDPQTGRHSPIRVCYAESRDRGRTWVRPELGLCEFAGSTANNIILDSGAAQFDNFSVFRDDNPACPAGERYKGVGVDARDGALWCFTSADGVRFEKSWVMTRQGKFDTLNVALWDPRRGEYRCYTRDFHDTPGDDWNAGVRDVRWMTSPDFRDWSTPVRLDFGPGADDYPLYTNVVQPYYRADHVYVGFPSRYVERKAWAPNFDQLGAPANVVRRRERMKQHPRYGLALTDCVFMSSRDGRTWKRWDEAFMTPGPEHEYNWVYGDCFPALGMIQTPSDRPGAPDELSMYTFENHWSGTPAALRRHTVRIDGFVSYHGTYEPCRVVTKPFLFQGGSLSLNFATSAIGWVRVKLLAGEETLGSCELFGDSLDRRVDFEGGNVTNFSGRPVRMEVTLRDADVFSFKFDA